MHRTDRSARPRAAASAAALLAAALLATGCGSGSRKATSGPTTSTGPTASTSTTQSGSTTTSASSSAGTSATSSSTASSTTTSSSSAATGTPTATSSQSTAAAGPATLPAAAHAAITRNEVNLGHDINSQSTSAAISDAGRQVATLTMLAARYRGTALGAKLTAAAHAWTALRHTLTDGKETQIAAALVRAVKADATLR